MDILYTFLIYSSYIHIYFLNMFHIFSLVCVLNLWRWGHDRSQSFGPISHASGPKLTFCYDFIMVLHGFAWRSSKNIVLRQKTLKTYQTSEHITKNPKHNSKILVSMVFHWKVMTGLVGSMVCLGEECSLCACCL